MAEQTAAAARPYNLVAELTYRCPLRCPYCSNPVGHAEIRDALDAPTWSRVFAEAADLGVLHVGLTGGEPSTRTDLEPIVAGAAQAGLYPHLVTAGTPIRPEGLTRLAKAGLRSVQLSVQDADADESDRIAGAESFETKRRFARAVRELDLPLILNVVLHRHNLDRVEEIIALARELDAERLELANTQYHGWALVNRDALIPSQAQLEAAAEIARRARRRFRRPEILFVLPDYFADRPKPCMGGWGRKNIVVAPDGTVQPCQAAATIPELEFWSVLDRPLDQCWNEAPGMKRFRGVDWMREPCRSCPKREIDFGGCRCQAFHLTGDASATDPACELSPHHEAVVAARSASDRAIIWRGGGIPPR